MRLQALIIARLHCPDTALLAGSAAVPDAALLACLCHLTLRLCWPNPPARRQRGYDLKGDLGHDPYEEMQFWRTNG